MSFRFPNGAPSIEGYRSRAGGLTCVVVHHADPDHAIWLQAQQVVHQPVRVEGTPPEAEGGGFLDRLDKRLSVPALDEEGDGRDARGGVRHRLADDGEDVGLGGEVVEQRFLQRMLVGHEGGPAPRGIAQVLNDVWHGLEQLIAGAREPEFLVERRAALEEVAEAAQVLRLLRRGLPRVHHGDVWAVDLVP